MNRSQRPSNNKPAVHSEPPLGPLVDSHAHLELEPLVHNPAAVVDRALKAGVALIVTVGIDLEDAKLALDIADRFDEVFASVGFHPHNAKDADERNLAKMENLAAHPKVKAYGEIGLDFFRNRSPHDRQRAAFAEQLSLAKSLEKPVVIHLRDAYPEGLAMLERAAPFPAGGVIHCFSGDKDDAERALDLGFHISIPGTLTYKKNDLLRGIVRTLPLERLLIETDCPFLTPEPFRGKDNEPAYIIHTARKLAEVRSESPEHIAEATTANACRFFGISLQ